MNFIILPKVKPVFEVEQLFIFYIGRHGDFRHKAGTYQGNINDMDFREKLERVRGRLKVKTIPYWEATGSTTIKEVKRLNDKERYDRRMSRLFNEFHRRVDAIRGDLFFEEKLKELCADWHRSVKIMKERYEQE